jgi:hypothetical protein
VLGGFHEKSCYKSDDKHSAALRTCADQWGMALPAMAATPIPQETLGTN